MYQDSIEIVVHRGANHVAPENTIPHQLSACIETWSRWIEVDVRKSKDNILYNLHDETLDRTTNGKGSIQDMLSKDIEKLDAGSWFSSRFTGIHVPRIAEMLDTLQGKAHIFFDVKRGTPIKDLITLVRQKGYENKSFFWFADSEMLKEFIKIAPEMKIKVKCLQYSGFGEMDENMHPGLCRNRYPQYHSSIQRILQKQSYQDNGCYSECE